MSSTATTQHVRQPVAHLGSGVIGTVVIGIALVALIGIAVMSLVLDDGSPVQFDPSAAQRIHVLRENGFGSVDAAGSAGALHAHLLRENGSD